MGLKTKLHDNFAQGTFTVDCSQTVGRTDFGQKPLEPALKGQYKFLMVKKLRCAIMEQYAKTSCQSLLFDKDSSNIKGVISF